MGLGDPWLTARTTWAIGPATLGGRLGLSLPLGRTEENPFALGRLGERHQHVQFGSGTVDPIAGVDRKLPATLSLSARFPVDQHFITDGSHDPGQLTYPVILNFTARRTFDVLGP